MTKPLSDASLSKLQSPVLPYCPWKYRSIGHWLLPHCEGTKYSYCRFAESPPELMLMVFEVRAPTVAVAAALLDDLRRPSTPASSGTRKPKRIECTMVKEIQETKLFKC